jgi:hypothetical protein
MQSYVISIFSAQLPLSCAVSNHTVPAMPTMQPGNATPPSGVGLWRMQQVSQHLSLIHLLTHSPSYSRVIDSLTHLHRPNSQCQVEDQD